MPSSIYFSSDVEYLSQFVSLGFLLLVGILGGLIRSNLIATNDADVDFFCNKIFHQLFDINNTILFIALDKQGQVKFITRF